MLRAVILISVLFSLYGCGGPGASERALVQKIKAIGGGTTAPEGMVIHIDFVNNKKVTSDLLAEVKGLTKLEVLDLTQASVTDEMLPSLYELDHINEIGLSNTQCTLEGIKKLEAEVPNVAIRHNITK